MNETAKSSSATPVDSPSKRKTYQAPKLHDFGRLHLVTQGTGPNNGDAGQTMMVPSDRRCKDRIVPVGVHPTGIGLYLFDYKPEFCAEWGGDRKFGVMADEVEAVLPEAVSVRADGYKQVNYEMLGIDLVRH